MEEVFPKNKTVIIDCMVNWSEEEKEQMVKILKKFWLKKKRKLFHVFDSLKTRRAYYEINKELLVPMKDVVEMVE